MVKHLDGRLFDGFCQSEFSIIDYLIQADFFEYLQVVHDAFEKDGPECNSEWKKAITDIESVIDGPPHRWKEFGGKSLEVKEVKLIIHFS